MSHPVPIGSGSAKAEPRAQFVDPKGAKPKGPTFAPPPPKAARKKAKKKKAVKRPTAITPADVAPPVHRPQRSKMVPVVKPKEVDVDTLGADETSKRCAAIYKLEAKVEAKRAIHELAKKNAKAARAVLTEAEDALETEIREQRFGPGPLFPVQ